MQQKQVLDRSLYKSDGEFERDVDKVASKLDGPGKRKLMFSLMRQCRGCGADVSYETLEYKLRHTRPSLRHDLVCTLCQHIVPIKQAECNSIGRVVTLWNTTGLTIEASHV